MGLNDYRDAFRESVIPVFVLILLDRYGELSSRHIRMYFERIGFSVSPRVLLRILERLADYRLCERVPTKQQRARCYAANANTAFHLGLFLEDLEDFSSLVHDFRDGKVHWDWGRGTLI